MHATTVAVASKGGILTGVLGWMLGDKDGTGKYSPRPDTSQSGNTTHDYDKRVVPGHQRIILLQLRTPRFHYKMRRRSAEAAATTTNIQRAPPEEPFQTNAGGMRAANDNPTYPPWVCRRWAPPSPTGGKTAGMRRGTSGLVRLLPPYQHGACAFRYTAVKANSTALLPILLAQKLFSSKRMTFTRPTQTQPNPTQPLVVTRKRPPAD